MKIIHFIASLSLLAISTPALCGEPVADFENFAKNCRTATNARPSDYLKQDGSKWTRFLEINKITYDVKKTDSLVSPLLGEIDIEATFYSESRESEDSARATAVVPGSSFQSTKQLRVRYVYQGNTWNRVRMALSGKSSMGYGFSDQEKSEDEVKRLSFFEEQCYISVLPISKPQNKSNSSKNIRK